MTKRKDPTLTLDELSIGMKELCNLLDLTPTAIRNYEKTAGLEVSKTSSGYRIFYMNDIQKCLRIKAYSELGFSIADAGRMAVQSNPAEIEEMLEKQNVVLTDQLKAVERKISYLQDYRHRFAWIRQLDSKCIMKKREGVYWFPLSEHGNINATKEQIAKLSKYAPFVENGLRLKSTEFHADGVGEVGLCVRDRYADILEEDTVSCAIHYRPCNCLACVVHANIDSDYYGVIDPMWDYMKENHLKADGDALSVQLAADLIVPWRNDKSYDYYICYIPVKEK